MRLVFISEGYPPVDGGVAISTQRIARNLTRLGVNVLVLTFDHSRPLSADDYTIEEKGEGFDIVRVGPFFRRVTVSEQAGAVARRRVYDQIERIASAFKPDIVMSFYATTPGLVGSYLAQHLNVPHIAGLRGNDVGRNIFSFYYQPIVLSIVQNSDWMVCVNDHIRNRLRLAFPKYIKRCTVISNTVEMPALTDTTNRPYLSEHTSWPKDSVVAVFIGMPREKKGIAYLLRATLLAAERAPKLRLLIAGPRLRHDDEEQCAGPWGELENRGLLHCTGHQHRDRALQVAAEGDLIVMPSLEDGLANGLLEGMALGMAPIMTDLFSEAVTKANLGWMVPRANTEELAQALETAVSSPAERQRYARAAKAYVAEYHKPSDESAAYLQLFRRLIRERETLSAQVQIGAETLPVAIE